MRAASPTAALVASALALTVAGCGVGGAIGRGISHYRDGRYGAAMRVFSNVAPLWRRMNRKGAVRYLVFRGLTHYRLRQMREARDFLLRGAAVYRRGPSRWLPRYAVAELRMALSELHRTGAGASAPPRSTPPAPRPSAPAPPL